MQTGRRRWPKTFVVLVLSGIAIVLIWRFLPREQLLLQRATRITSIGGPYEINLGIAPGPNNPFTGMPTLNTYDPYFWKSSREVIIFRHTSGGTPHYQAFCLNMETGVQESMTALNKVVEAETNKMAMKESTSGQGSNLYFEMALAYGICCALSPDGKWFLWPYPNDPVSSPKWHYVALALDGPQRITWDKTVTMDFPTSPIWLPDSRHWLLLQQDFSAHYAIQIFSLDSPKSVNRIALSTPESGPPGSSPAQVLGIIPSGNILIANSDTQAFFGHLQQTQDKALSEFKISQPRKTGRPVVAVQTHQYSVRMPQYGTLADSWRFWETHPVLSPHGDRFAWLVESEYTPSGPS